MSIGIKGIEYYLPDKVLDNEELSEIYPDWSDDKIYKKTGIKSRHVAETNETVSDLAIKASKKIFNTGIIKPEEVNFVVLGTQTPDYILPTTACIVQDKLGIPKTAGAFDFNLGCSAFIYGLAISKGLIQANIAKNVLLIMSEMYSKHIHPLDKSVRTIFGDGAAAIVIGDSNSEILEFDLGTDGSGKDKLIIPAGGAVLPKSQETSTDYEDEDGYVRSKDNLFMDGTGIFNFSIEVVPDTINRCLIKNNISVEDIDLFIFHQANKFMLDFLRKKLRIPKDKFYINMEDTGNTVSASIPIALKRAEAEGRISKGAKVMLVGFGVGLSWGSAIIQL
jgi:3-oxoacyl-[acyl-carrier-protein] synthase-3